MGYIIIFFILLTYSSMLTITLKKKIDETLPISIVEIILIIYVFGIFDKLEIGIKVIQIITIIQLIIMVIILLLKKNKEDIKMTVKKIVTPRVNFIYNFIY